MLIGLLAMFFTIRLFHVHQHSFADPSVQDDESGSVAATCTDHGHPGHAHEHHGHAHDHHGAQPAAAWRFSWVGLAFGLVLHSFFDGVALGAQLAADLHIEHAVKVPGAGVFLVVLLHKPLDALAITTLMSTSGWSIRSMLAVNVAFAAVCPAGAALFYLGAAQHTAVVGAALALAAGVFICIALADILPEVSFHSHDRAKLSVGLILGVLLAISIGWLEGEGHGHGPSHTHPHSHSHGDVEPHTH
jgi:zinc and cadmium transporter